MSKTAIVWESRREEYEIGEVRSPMTVGRLRAILEDFDEDTLVIISHGNGYTYGTLHGEPEYLEARPGKYGELEWEAM